MDPVHDRGSMDLVHDRGSMDLVYASGPWTQSKVVHVLSSPSLCPTPLRHHTNVCQIFKTLRSSIFVSFPQTL